MVQPPYYLERPKAALIPEIVASFERVYCGHIRNGYGGSIEYTLSAPKWQFLNYIADLKDVVLHGSGDSTISEFQPRQSVDVTEFGNQRAVYAASDGIWATYFAIVDRDRYVRSLVNTCFRVRHHDEISGPYYYFSINGDALQHCPWRNGTIYILSRETFEPRQRDNDSETPEWRSLVPVKPLAKITVGPSDFPFLDQIHGHDPATVQKRAVENPNGFPWLDE